MWKGGTTISEGRAMLRDGKGGRIRRYRKVVEDIIGRQLLKREVVHHINENSLNDVVTNLYRFRNSSAHLRWHLFLRRHALPGEILVSNLI